MTLTIGATGTITATVSPDNASNKKVNWSSSNEAAATVANGVVTARAVGTATITATSAANNSKKASCVVTVEAAPEAPVAANFVSTGNVGIAPESAGDAAGKIYAEYKLVADEKDISLAEGNVEYIKVKVGEAEEWEELAPNTDATLWFNLEATEGERTYEVKTKDSKVYTATLDRKEAIKAAAWEATSSEGDHDGVTYVEYQMMDGESQVSLEIGNVKLIASKDADGKWVALEPNTDSTLWFNKAHETGNYEFFVVTSKGAMYKAILDWTQPAVAVVRENGDVAQDSGETGGENLTYDFVAEGKVLTIDAHNTELPYYVQDGTTPPRGANWVGVAISIPDGVNTEDVTATINDAECTDLFFADDEYMEYIDVKDADLSEGAATYRWVIKWGAGYADETITINLINVAGLEAPEKEVSGSIAWDPGKTGGELDVTIEGNTVTFTSGKIAWYPADETLGRTAGNRVGVEITVPADFDTKDTKVTIGEKEYTWEEIKDGDNFFWWYPLVTADKKEFTATVVWNENSTQVFTVVVGEGVMLEEAPEAPVASTYKFDYTVPENIIKDQEVGIDVTFATDVKGDFGYDKARFNFAATGPEEANVTFKAIDSNEIEHTFTNEGVWGPEAGFTLPADYTATTTWKVTFDKAGDYTITFELINLDDNEAVIAEGSETIIVK
jgi:hypothetical protein